MNRIRSVVTAAALALVLALPALAAAAGAASPTTFTGTTSQGKAITVQFVPNGTKGIIRFKTKVTGQCRMTGARTRLTEGQNVADYATGAFPAPAFLYWDHKQPTYEIYFSLKGLASAHSIHGVLRASWRTKIDNIPACATRTIRWSAAR